MICPSCGQSEWHSDDIQDIDGYWHNECKGCGFIKMTKEPFRPDVPHDPYLIWEDFDSAI